MIGFSTTPLYNLLSSICKRVEAVEKHLGITTPVTNNTWAANQDLDLLNGRINPQNPVAINKLVEAAEKYLVHGGTQNFFKRFLADKLGINPAIYRRATLLKAIGQIKQNALAFPSKESFNRALNLMYVLTFGENFNAEEALRQSKLVSRTTIIKLKSFFEQLIKLNGDELTKFLSKPQNKGFFKELSDMPLIFGAMLYDLVPAKLSQSEQLDLYEKIYNLVTDQEEHLLNTNLSDNNIHRFNQLVNNQEILIQEEVCDLLNKYYASSDHGSSFTEFIKSNSNGNEHLELIQGKNANQLVALMMRRMAANSLQASDPRDLKSRSVNSIQKQSLPVFVSFLFTLLTDNALSPVYIERAEENFFNQSSSKAKREEHLHDVLYKLSYDCLNLSPVDSKELCIQIEDPIKARGSKLYQKISGVSIDKAGFEKLIEFVNNYKKASNSPAHSA